MAKISVDIRSTKFDIDAGRCSPNPASAEIYDGDYVVTPQVDSAVVLPTENKLLEHNVTVLQIPIYQVSNPSGGKTLTIGEITNG